MSITRQLRDCFTSRKKHVASKKAKRPSFWMYAQATGDGIKNELYATYVFASGLTFLFDKCGLDSRLQIGGELNQTATIIAAIPAIPFGAFKARADFYKSKSLQNIPVEEDEKNTQVDEESPENAHENLNDCIFDDEELPPLTWKQWIIVFLQYLINVGIDSFGLMSWVAMMQASDYGIDDTIENNQLWLILTIILFNLITDFQSYKNGEMAFRKDNAENQKAIDYSYSSKQCELELCLWPQLGGDLLKTGFTVAYSTAQLITVMNPALPRNLNKENNLLMFKWMLITGGLSGSVEAVDHYQEAKAIKKEYLEWLRKYHSHISRHHQYPDDALEAWLDDTTDNATPLLNKNQMDDHSAGLFSLLLRLPFWRQTKDCLLDYATDVMGDTSILFLALNVSSQLPFVGPVIKQYKFYAQGGAVGINLFTNLQTLKNGLLSFETYNLKQMVSVAKK